jgi:hypothetical protein
MKDELGWINVGRSFRKTLSDLIILSIIQVGVNYESKKFQGEN